jgi:hypothetical protein
MNPFQNEGVNQATAEFAFWSEWPEKDDLGKRRRFFHTFNPQCLVLYTWPASHSQTPSELIRAGRLSLSNMFSFFSRRLGLD